MSIAIAVLALAGAASASATALKVMWMPGFKAAGTPLKYDKVGVIKVGSPKAKNVLVLEPGTSAGGAYFVPLAKWIVSTTPSWQVWSVERRENLLEDQSVIDKAKAGKASPQAVFNYYLGWIYQPQHHAPLPARPGLRRPVRERLGSEGGGRGPARGDRRGSEARRQGRARRSLARGLVVTGYATWNFNGKPGADDLAGLVYDDGASFRSPPSAQTARQTLQQFMLPEHESLAPFVAGSRALRLRLSNVTGGAVLDPRAGPAARERRSGSCRRH